MPDLDAMKDLLLEIVRKEILNIRMFGWNEQAKECSFRADHIHNLPELIRRPRIESLQYYLEVERPCYTKQISNPTVYQKEWSQLERILEQWKTEVSSNQGTKG